MRRCTCERCEVGQPEKEGDCHLCWLYHNVRKYRVHWGGPEEGPDLPIPKRGGGTRQTPSGPGTELKHLLASIGITEASGCGCGAKAAEMNRWGVAGCKEHRAEIIAWLREQQQKAGWAATLTAGINAVAAGLWLNPLDLLGSLVDEAIRRASRTAE